MKHIHLMKGKEVDVFLHERDRKEMTGTVQMHATPGETGCVMDNDRTQHVVCNKGFAKCLDTIEHTCA